MDILISTLSIAAFILIVAAVIILRPQDQSGHRPPATSFDDLEAYWHVDQSYRTAGTRRAGACLMWVMLVILAFVALIAMVVIQTTVM